LGGRLAHVNDGKLWNEFPPVPGYTMAREHLRFRSTQTPRAFGASFVTTGGSDRNGRHRPREGRIVEILLTSDAEADKQAELFRERQCSTPALRYGTTRGASMSTRMNRTVNCPAS
jgi:hypothetical protein